MSQPRSTKQQPASVKPNADRYTVLLIIALIAMIIGCVLLYLELGAQGIGAFSQKMVTPMFSQAGEPVGTVFAASRFFVAGSFAHPQPL